VKRFVQYLASGLLLTALFSFSARRAGEEPRRNNRDTLHVNKAVSHEELVYMVDSILDLDTISPQAIALITYYNNELEKLKHSKLSFLPAEEFYEDFDEETVFQPAADESLPDLMNLMVTSDSLGAYTPPTCGIVTSNYGWRDKRMHKGIDIDLNKGDKVLCAFDGMVRIARRQNGYGNVVIVRHYNGLETVYAHLSKIRVKAGQVISSGDVVGLGGATGHATGTHLHFEVRFKGHALNPANLISFTDHRIYNNTLTLRKSKYGLAAFPCNATVYTVQRGDSWYEIAKRFGLTSQQMKTLNGTDKRFYLKVGQQIRIN
jgi:murein DD-endopeptidase MepM/ murein hydrolase activator NlpD